MIAWRAAELGRVLIFGFVFSLVSLSGCKEELPTYQDPQDVLQGLLVGDYTITRTENAMKAYFSIKNMYDETLEARSILTGRMVLTWDKDPTFRRTIDLNDVYVIYAKSYNSTTRVLRLDPGDSIRLGFSWTFLSDDGRDLRQLVFMISDPTCLVRNISQEDVQMHVEAWMDIFERTQTVSPKKIIYRFQLVREFVDPRACG